MKILSLPTALIFASLIFSSCQKNTAPTESLNKTPHTTEFYSSAGHEVLIEFKGVFKTNKTNLESILSSKNSIEKYDIPQATKFMFGPLTHQELAGIQKGEKIQVIENEIEIKEDYSLIPYNYSATWIVHQNIATDKEVQLALPFNTKDLYTKNWKKCTDSNASHQDPSVFWYYWDPTRYGCDHTDGKEFQYVTAYVIEINENTKDTYPEYSRLIRMKDDQKTLPMTFAFGYVEDEHNSDPFKSQDWGMKEFKKFLGTVRTFARQYEYTESNIKQSLYDSSIEEASDRIIGKRFEIQKDDILMIIHVVTASDIDQMDLFAQSFAVDHEGFFAWFGHSRVGSGFDAMMFSNKLTDQPEKFSLTDDYQLIYWAGCNSYSYYTLPFFDLKGGTKNLDIISNGLPSYFHYNADSATILLKALTNIQQQTSYQNIVNEIEDRARSEGITILSNVLGDEDNLN